MGGEGEGEIEKRDRALCERGMRKGTRLSAEKLSEAICRIVSNNLIRLSAEK